MDFRPTASLEILRLRAKALAAIRRFFHDNGYWEVETPILSTDIVVDAHLDPFTTKLHDHAEKFLYLQTSPEAGMKRLLAAGADAIFQITRAFRRGESGRLHNPEFTIVEWYRVGDNHHDQMRFTEQLVRYVFRELKQSSTTTAELPDRDFERLTYDTAFKRVVGTPVLGIDAARLVQLALAQNVTIPESIDKTDCDGLLNLLLAEMIEPQLVSPTFIHDYPASQAALAMVRQEEIPVAERFELYLAGLEICNGYHELTDADELRKRITQQNEIRDRDGRAKLPGCPALLAAMDAGMPSSSGVALGFDRLLMAALNCESISEVVAFPLRDRS